MFCLYHPPPELILDLYPLLQQKYPTAPRAIGRKSRGRSNLPRFQQTDTRRGLGLQFVQNVVNQEPMTTNNSMATGTATPCLKHTKLGDKVLGTSIKKINKNIV
jgi:hypothetical protein